MGSLNVQTIGFSIPSADNHKVMSVECTNYESIIDHQAVLVSDHGTEKPRRLISKDVRYFDSTELEKELKHKTAGVNSSDNQHSEANKSSDK